VSTYTLLTIIGIAYIAEFGAQITKDAGQGAIASKIELAGKILILVMAIPIIFSNVSTYTLLTFASLATLSIICKIA
ncbi:SpoIIIAC/SpoIIIAD family protein, partial [Bacillus sp. D-CC]